MTKKRKHNLRIRKRSEIPRDADNLQKGNE